MIYVVEIDGGEIQILDAGGSVIDPAKEGTLDAARAILAAIRDTHGVKQIVDPLPAGSNEVGKVAQGTGAAASGAWPEYLTDGAGNVIDATLDALEGKRRLEVTGKVVSVPPSAPAGATKVTVAGDTPLSISSTQTASYVIPSGTSFVLQMLAAGAEGDPTAKGSKVEVWYYDGAVERLVERLYLVGQTVSVYPDAAQARDGTTMGPSDGTHEIHLRRIRLSASPQEVDAVARGYVQ